MTTTLAIIIGVAGLLGIVALICWYIYSQGKKMSRLAISEEAYRDRDKIEKKTDAKRSDIDRDLPGRIAAARERVSGEVESLADEIAKLHDPDGT